MKLTEPLKKAFVREHKKVLTTYVGRETDGKLKLNLDTIADLISIHVKPQMDDHDKFLVEFQKELDGQEADRNFLEKFEGRSFDAYIVLEREYINLVLNQLEKI